MSSCEMVLSAGLAGTCRSDRSASGSEQRDGCAARNKAAEDRVGDRGVTSQFTTRCLWTIWTEFPVGAEAGWDRRWTSGLADTERARLQARPLIRKRVHPEAYLLFLSPEARRP